LNLYRTYPLSGLSKQINDFFVSLLLRLNQVTQTQQSSSVRLRSSTSGFSKGKAKCQNRRHRREDRGDDIKEVGIEIDDTGQRQRRAHLAVEHSGLDDEQQRHNRRNGDALLTTILATIHQRTNLRIVIVVIQLPGISQLLLCHITRYPLQF